LKSSDIDAHMASAGAKAWASSKFYVVAALIILIFVGIWMLIPWEWAPVDDPGQVILLNQRIDSMGRIPGMLDHILFLYRGDAVGGVFRPAAWLYPALIYQLPISLAHVVRLLMVIAAVLGPIIYLRRMGSDSARLWVSLLIVIAGASTLYQGLFLLSLQEISGAAFVGLGLMARRNTVRVILWFIAVLFKAPFAWLLVGNAIYLWHQKKHRQAVFSAAIGLGSLAMSAIWSRNGFYSAGYNLNIFDPALWENFARLVEPMNALLLVSLVWWLIFTNGSLKRHPEWIVFAIGWAGYTLQMIPWGVTAYYMGPISYLFALVLIFLITNSNELSRREIVVGLAMPILVAVWLVRLPLNLGFDINSVMLESRQCLAPLSNSHTVVSGNLLYVTSSPEGPTQIKGTVERFDPSWIGTVVLEDSQLSGFGNPETTHYLTVGAVQLPQERSATEVCSGRAITLYELDTVDNS